MDYCLVLSSISCKLQKKAIEFETRISNRTVYKQVPDAKPYASLWLSTELLEQFNWQHQVPVMKGDSLIAVKVLHRNLTGSTLQYLILHIEHGVYSKAVHHQIEFEGVVGKSKALSLTSKNLVSGDIATWRNDVKDTEDRTTLRANTRKYSTEYSPGATTLPMVTVTAKYRQGSLVTFTPMTFVLVNGAFAAATPSGDIINNYTPYQDLAYLEPADTPESGTAATEYPYSTNRMLPSGIWYSIDDYPYKDKGFPWFWMEDPDWRSPEGYLYSRMAQLYEELEQNPKALINCQELQALMAYGPMFQQISTFQAPPSVVSRLNEARQQAPNFVVDNFNIQSLQDASGSVVNCDFFPVRITQLPTGFTAESLLEYFRTHINEFISPSQNKSFHPYQDGSFNDAARFFSAYEASVGALIHIDMATSNGPLPLPSDGSVMISDYRRNTYSGGNQWHRYMFSTLETPLDFEHPVAGNRQFGIYSNPSNLSEFTFYTMGVDRTWDWSTSVGNRLIDGFKDADRLWNNVQENFIKFINTNGGSANTYTPKEYVSRPKWELVKDFLLGNIDFATFKMQMGC
jgi:hypothetical protein